MALSAGALVLVVVACREPPSARSKRSQPICATQDCDTGKVIDDGCAADGRCASCVNACSAPIKSPGSSEK
jgi:hypothetical protein